MEPTVCPYCGRKIIAGKDRCPYCLSEIPLPELEDFKPLRFTGKTASDTPEGIPLPSADVDQENSGDVYSLEEFVMPRIKYNYSAKAAKAALGDYAVFLLTKQHGDQPVLMRDTAVKQLVACGIFTLVGFLAIMLYCVYHREAAVYLLILGADIIAAWIAGKNITSHASLVKKIVSMPDTDIESIVMSCSDETVPESKVKHIRWGIMAVAALLLCVLFVRPHMIFERNASGYSLRYYTAALILDRDVMIPATHHGMPVNEIRGNVFQNLFMIRHATLPPGVSEIHAYTFQGCSGLEEIALPEGVVRVAAHAFYGCASLKQVTVPDSLMSIGSSAFRRCHSLMSIELPGECFVDSKAFKESPTSVIRR